MTTVASVWTNNEFHNGTALQGHALGLKIAAGNVPNFVDLQTGGWGTTIQDPLNSSQTPTMANFATLADVLAGCVTRVQHDACGKLLAAATGPCRPQIARCSRLSRGTGATSREFSPARVRLGADGEYPAWIPTRRDGTSQPNLAGVRCAYVSRLGLPLIPQRGTNGGIGQFTKLRFKPARATFSRSDRNQCSTTDS